MNILEEVYFLTIEASDYREISCFASEEELKDYIECEFSATDGEEILKYTIAQLMEGKSYGQSHRMGSGTTRTYVRVIHKTNLSDLYPLLDSSDWQKDNDEPLPLSSYLKNAESFEEIQEIIDAFNESCENYW